MRASLRAAPLREPDRWAGGEWPRPRRAIYAERAGRWDERWAELLNEMAQRKKADQAIERSSWIAEPNERVERSSRPNGAAG